MPTTLERYGASGFAPPWVAMEHESRYEFAQQYVAGVVVDCACGSGEGSARFAASADQVLAFDVSADAIAYARQNHQRSNIQYACGDATSLPVPGDSVDVYVSLETIEHLVAPDDYLREARRVLRPGGRFICSTPNRTVTNPGKTLACRPANRFHVREYNVGEFLELLSAHFRHVELFGMNPVPRWLPTYLGVIGRSGTGHLSTRVHQAVKALASLVRSRRYHGVVALDSRLSYEYLVAVART